ncbi:glycosyltransferase family 2 protein [Arthrospiribacter ruber]|uniref:Glycosyltransferase family 2 protein n=1 Tax=Arthrospiribacter ruber TaxID=2487934 RepID=A0A951ITE4_9BACT|nr:glycosyltransferase family A protein [Arthrospiribacter ruber]MBW3466297.1 glycosyltransferase family 2 protein [Arthrospiribacter ruber]
MEKAALDDLHWPKVSVICTSYNHEKFLSQALESILEQDYPNLEIVLIDNGSKDRSPELLTNWCGRFKDQVPIHLILRPERINYCKSFNEGFDLATGKYFVDFSTDDQFLVNHLKKMVQKMEQNPEAAAVFSDAYLINGTDKKTFFPRKGNGELIHPVEEGFIFKRLVSSHYVLSAAMMMDADSFRVLGKYDETLEYEDFDILVRMARKFPLFFSNHVGVAKYGHEGAFSKEQYKSRNSRTLPSTLKVCWKIASMNRNKEENEALSKRVVYEWRQALLSANFEVAEGFLELAEKLQIKGSKFTFFRSWTKTKLDVSFVFQKLSSFAV